MRQKVFRQSKNEYLTKLCGTIWQSLTGGLNLNNRKSKPLAGRKQRTGKTQPGKWVANEQVWHQAGEGGVEDKNKKHMANANKIIQCHRGPTGRAESIQETNIDEVVWKGSCHSCCVESGETADDEGERFNMLLSLCSPPVWSTVEYGGWNQL